MRLIFIDPTDDSPLYARVQYSKFKEHYKSSKLFSEILFIRLTDSFSFEDMDYVFVFFHKTMHQLNYCIAPYIEVKKIKINLMIVARGTSLLYKQKHYVDWEDEIELYNSKLFYHKFVLTYTQHLSNRLIAYFKNKVDFDFTHFLFMGYVLPDLEKSEEKFKNKNRIIIVDKENGFKNSEFILYGLKKYFENINEHWEICIFSDEFKKDSLDIIFDDRVSIYYFSKKSHIKFLKLLSTSKYFITASLCDTLNYSLIEAHLLGCTVIAPNVYPYKEYFQDNFSQYSFEPFQIDSFIKVFVSTLGVSQNLNLASSYYEMDRIVNRLENGVRGYHGKK